MGCSRSRLAVLGHRQFKLAVGAGSAILADEGEPLGPAAIEATAPGKSIGSDQPGGFGLLLNGTQIASSPVDQGRPSYNIATAQLLSMARLTHKRADWMI
jgi:hypothetical protein